jgi:hypothetical protein
MIAPDASELETPIGTLTDDPLGDDVDAQIEQQLEAERAKDLLRFSTAGSVDDGKSTLIGRLLYDSRNVYDDHIRSVTHNAAIDFAQLTDGLRAEREQGITIDVAYRYFSTPKRKFIIADTPGHEQYTRNMATGASPQPMSPSSSSTRAKASLTRRGATPASLRYSVFPRSSRPSTKWISSTFLKRSTTVIIAIYRHSRRGSRFPN